MDGEVCRAECSSATTAEGHHISNSNFTVLDCSSSPSIGRIFSAGFCPIDAGVELALSVHSFICFMFSLRQTFFCVWKSVGIQRQTWGMLTVQICALHLHPLTQI